MRRQPSLRSQLNQIRMWVRQGRTDAWIAHKLDISVDELSRFKREHDLEGDGEQSRARPADPLSVPPPEPPSDELDEDEGEDELEEDEQPRRERPRRRSRRSRSRPAAPSLDADEEDDVGDELPAAVEAGADDDDEDADGAPRRRRRRGRRGGRRHRSRRAAYEATFDHGDEGYGLWLDPAVVDNPVYAEYWAGHRAVTVTLDAEAITIRRAEPGVGEAGAGEPDAAEAD